MRSICSKSAIAVSAAIASLGMLRMAPASAILIENNESAVVDGWNITAPKGVSLAVTASVREIFIEKAANFTQPNQGFQVAFQWANWEDAATDIDFTDETIQNNSGQAFSGFQFILMNTGFFQTTFEGPSTIFAPPRGTGYNYGGGTLNSSLDILSYTGNQDAGTTSSWGGTAGNDELLINARANSDFSLKELPESNGGGVIPVPSAAWQSLVGLAALGLIAAGKKHRLASGKR